MGNLKTYSISSDITGGSCNSSKLHVEVLDSGHVSNFDGILIDGDSLTVIGDSLVDEVSLDSLILGHVDSILTHRILQDTIVDKNLLAINYKTELGDNIVYTPVYYIHTSGVNAGLLDKTEYYRNYVDENNKGELVLTVSETYVIDQSDVTLNNTAKPAVSRTKTWTYTMTDGSNDNNNTKTRAKLYDTRRKSHIEGNRRRHNIMEQLIDNVGTAGVLSGTFAGSSDAHSKLTDLQTTYNASFSAWLNSGRGSIFDDVTNDVTHAWLTNTVADNASTQAMVPWMIGLTYKSYIVDKLKGDID